MYHWMQTQGKWLMVIFGTLLMVVFILPMGMLGGGGSRNPVRGKMGTFAIHENDLQRYRNEWQYLNHYAFTQQRIYSDDGTSKIEWQPIGNTLSNQALAEFQSHPDMYALLIEESRQMGVGVSKDTLNSLMENAIKTRDNDNSGKLIKPSQSTDADRVPYLRQCLADFLLMEGGMNRAASTIKVSMPLRQHLLASDQTISLNLVQFSAEPYLAKAPAPTQQQLEAQFKKYADVDPATADPQTNPFAFGYRYPDRLKIQYISVPSSAVSDAALNARNKNDQTRYDWDVAAYRYYEANQSAFATTQPTTQSSAKAKATIRPFKEVEDQARQGVLRDDTDQLTQSIHQRIISVMAQDYLTWKNSKDNATKASTPAKSSLGVPYDSYEYMNRLAQLIQKDYGVLPTVDQTGKWQTASTLDSLPGIGVATVDSPDLQPVPFSSYAMWYDKFLPEGQRDQAAVLGLFKPSEPLKNYDDDFYLFRISDAQTAHAPANLAEVKPQVEKDLRLKEAYQQAHQQAEKFLDQAHKDSSVTAAAKSAGKDIIAAGPLSGTTTMATIPGYPALKTPMLQKRFMTEAFDLLGTATQTNQHPIGLIALRPQGLALIGQISSVQSLPIPESDLPQVKSILATQYRNSRMQKFEMRWFDYADLVARTDYHEVAAPSQPSAPRNPQPMPPPL